MLITGAGTADNVVEGDYIGTDLSGKYTLPNGGNGVQIQSGSTNNTVGGTSAAARDVISGNAYSGVLLTGSGTGGNLVEGDFIGTDPTGKNAVPNYYGVAITAGATGNTVGGTSVAARDVISGNTGFGVFITGGGTNSNSVEGDYLGTDVTGTAAVPLPSTTVTGGAVASRHQAYGVLINGGAVSNLIGARDVISANDSCGVAVSDAGTTGNVVTGDFIGTVASGELVLGNGGNGVVIQNGAADNIIGGSTALGRDVISGNDSSGVVFTGAGTSNNVVEGDYIGTDAAGQKVLANAAYGLAIVAGAGNNTIGGTSAAARDVVSGNGLAGVFLNGVGTTSNVVEGDFIGTNAAGNAALNDSSDDVIISGGAASNMIGGTTAGAHDVVSGNAATRVLLSDPGTTGNAVEGDFIGTNAAGNAILGSGSYGVSISNGASFNVIGGSTTSAADVIAGNAAAGVAITGQGTDDNSVAEDKIGVNAADNAALGNQIGVLLAGGASINLVDSCVISGNVTGVEITDAGTTGNNVEFNFIGTDSSGKINLGNTQYGIVLDGTSGNLIAYDTVANSGLYGIVIMGGDTDEISNITITFFNNKDGDYLME